MNPIHNLIFPLLLLTAITLTGGCSKQHPVSAFLDFSLSEEIGTVYSGNETALITTRDKRSRPEVIFYSSGSSPLALPAAPPVTDLLTTRLAEGFSKQGLILTRDQPRNLIKVDISRLDCKISWDKGLYRLETVTSLSLTVDTSDHTLTRQYNRAGEEKKLTRPAVHDAEEMLRDQLEEIVTLIVNDEEIRDVLID